MSGDLVVRDGSARLLAFAGAMVGVARVLSAHGWEVRALDVDAVLGRMDIRIHRADGRWVHARVEDGKCVVERWQRSVPFGLHSSEKARGPARHDYVSDLFLGRFKVASPIAAFRLLANYITDNTPEGCSLSGRDILRPALDAWHKAGEGDG